MKQDDKPFSLRFTLMNTYSFRLDAPLVPVLYVRFPINSTSTLNANSSSPNLNTSYIDIIRILDPEHHEPFISIGRLLSLIQPNPISPITAIEILKDLNQSLIKSSSTNYNQSFKPIYSLLLNGLAPFPDLWVNLKLARQFSIRFGLLKVNDSNQKEEGLLASLLDWDSRAIWSVVTLSSVKEPIRTGELVSNWRIPEDVLPLRDYSLASLQETSFNKLELRPQTIGEDELLRLPITIPKQDPLRIPNFKTFPDTLLSEICLLSSDLLNETQIDEGKMNFRVLRCLESLGSLVLGNYLDLNQCHSINLKDQIDSLGILLFSIWKHKIIGHQIDQFITSSSSSVSSVSSDSSSSLRSNSITSEDHDSQNIILPIQSIESKLEKIEIQLKEVLSFQKVNDLEPLRNHITNQSLGLDFLTIQSKWIWISLIGLAYMLGRIQGDG